MEQQYKKELSEIHAPKELILKTKEAVRKEEERLKTQKNADVQKIEEQKKVSNITDIASRRKTSRASYYVGIAAALVIFVGAGVLNLGPKGGNNQPEPNPGTQMGVQLGEENKENEISIIQEKSLYTVEQFAEGATLDFGKEPLADFQHVEAVNRENMTYRAVVVDDGMKLYVEYDNRSYIFRFASTNIDLILPMIDDYFAE